MHRSDRALDKPSSHKAKAHAGGLEINQCLQNELVFNESCSLNTSCSLAATVGGKTARTSRR